MNPTVPVGRRRRIDVRWVDQWLAAGGYRLLGVVLSGHMQVSANCSDRQRQLEARARAAFELRAGRELTDAEWTAMRAKLVEFAAILRRWEQATTTSAER